MKAKMFRGYRSHNEAPAYPIPRLYLTMRLTFIPQPQSPFFGDSFPCDCFYGKYAIDKLASR